jgi:hypothetical protein
MGRKERKVKIRQRLSIAERLRTVPFAVKCFAVVAFGAAAVGFGAYAAYHHVHGHHALVMQVESVSVSGVPAWVDRTSARELEAPPGGMMPAEVYLLDREPLTRLATYYAQHEWVRSIESLEYVFPGKNAPGGIACRLTLEEPLCVVGWEKTNEYYYAASDGRRLGGPLPELPDPELRLPAVVWARDAVIPDRGQPWSEERVLHGMDIAAILEQEDLRSGLPHWIVRIDVSHVGRRDRSEILLVTENRIGLAWGRTPRSERAGRVQEAPAEEKIERLRRILSGESGEARGVEINLFEPLEEQRGSIGWLGPGQP